jgi:hypothetical protein
MKPVLIARTRGRGSAATFSNAFRPAVLRRRNPEVPLTPSQQKAADNILEILLGKKPGPNATERLTIAVLAGPAGTGKTTLMRYVKKAIEATGSDVMLLAPTGKAAARLRDLTGGQTATVHTGLLSGPTDVGMCPSCGQWAEGLGINPAIAQRRGIRFGGCDSVPREHP